jgi:hypothetical protein
VLRFRLRLMVNEVRRCGLKHQKEKRSMDHLAGLDVSVKYRRGCIVNRMGFGRLRLQASPMRFCKS